MRRIRCVRQRPVDISFLLEWPTSQGRHAGKILHVINQNNREALHISGVYSKTLIARNLAVSAFQL